MRVLTIFEYYDWPESWGLKLMDRPSEPRLFPARANSKYGFCRRVLALDLRDRLRDPPG